jgi:hypothetical protein
MFGTCYRQPVNANATVRGGNSPFRLHQLFLEKALKSRIQGAFLDLKQVVGGSLDVLHEGVAVQGLTLQGSEDHHLQGAWKKVSLIGFFHERESAPGLSVRDHLGQGLEQNSVIVTGSQELFLSYRQDSIEFVPPSEF